MTPWGLIGLTISVLTFFQQPPDTQRVKLQGFAVLGIIFSFLVVPVADTFDFIILLALNAGSDFTVLILYFSK